MISELVATGRCAMSGTNAHARRWRRHRVCWAGTHQFAACCTALERLESTTAAGSRKFVPNVIRPQHGLIQASALVSPASKKKPVSSALSRVI
jgi:hypothetical protein